MKTKTTIFQKIIEIITLLVLVAMIITVVTLFRKMPDVVPIHYNISGQIDGWGSKYVLLISPIIGVVICVGFFILLRVPRIWNMPFEPNENSKYKLYKSTRSLIGFLNLDFSLVFFYISYTTISVQKMSPLFIPVELVVIFGTLLYFLSNLSLINCYSKKKIVIDREVARLKNTFAVSKCWLIIPCLLIILPYIYLENENGNSGLIFAIIISCEVISTILGYFYSVKIQPKFFTEIEDINCALNRLRVRELSRSFVFAANIASVSEVISYDILFKNDFQISAVVIFIFVAHILAIVLFFNITGTRVKKTEIAFLTDEQN